MKNKITKLLIEGKTYSEIRRELSCSKWAIARCAKSLNLKKPSRNRYNWQEIQVFHNKKNNRTRCMEKFGFSWPAWDKAKKRGNIIAIDCKAPIKDFLIENSPISQHCLRDFILKEKILDYKCSNCGINEWMGQSLALRLDHINGVRNDDRIENLRFLCHNCDSLMETYGGKNITFQKKLGKSY